ncbi:Calpain small subunit, putative [Perkinsus marinus ATCC 50983]|uniref:Calpain small subunit, putative n=1 Tax=Perkinsus marinus (strain ATCC 50983 / TXsc) TaxID=423536 RepID=C5K7E4_PERM5|nr:Calpain small subunit, putative [Perkinsus marinus ATCC 50983]EER19479.1 Calpain small subunit, putative [Perkinsus marinus ATCC 50983]|eukprot:XP_002787683.1 Calpain small subunit, putative [Perkinsus marinus ATCC 50983]
MNVGTRGGGKGGKGATIGKGKGKGKGGVVSAAPGGGKPTPKKGAPPLGKGRGGKGLLPLGGIVTAPRRSPKPASQQPEVDLFLDSKEPPTAEQLRKEDKLIRKQMYGNLYGDEVVDFLSAIYTDQP